MKHIWLFGVKTYRLIAIGDLPKGFQVQLGYMCS